MKKEEQPLCYIVAGPNGAGKTMFALKYLPKVADCHRLTLSDLSDRSDKSDRGI